jgi:hypothetical protein
MVRTATSAAFLLIAGLASADGPVDPAPPAMAAQASEPVIADVHLSKSKAEQRWYCRNESQLGSRIAQRRCYLRGEEEEGEWVRKGLTTALNRQELERMRDQQMWLERMRQEEMMRRAMMGR